MQQAERTLDINIRTQRTRPTTELVFTRVVTVRIEFIDLVQSCYRSKSKRRRAIIIIQFV